MFKLFRAVLPRLLVAVFSIALQLAVWVSVLIIFIDYADLITLAMLLLSIFCAGYIIISDTQNENKIPWIIVMFIMPVAGGIFYLNFGRYKINKKTKRVYQKIDKELKTAMEIVPDRAEELFSDDNDAYRQSQYIKKISNAPAYTDTEVTYFPLGENKLAAMKEELAKAERFIFMEYFIIERGKMWNEIEEILFDRAAAGVDVRLLYDDFGCLMTLPKNFRAKMIKNGIKCHVVNPFSHLFNANFNNRDHRKICVIDGNVGFTGGINLADEYINHIVKHGHWKDTAVMLKGAAVYSLCATFLSMWSAVTGEIENIADFAPTKSYKSDGVVQPYYDTPLDNEAVGETVYMNILNKADDYVYITSPYLIISREMAVALKTAAKSGVDVRIITPGIADKKFVHFLSRSYYRELINAGVRIYEYTPGFIHSKMFICDDKIAVVGTINLDYRSLSLHYENGVWFYSSSVVSTIKEDYLTTLLKTTEITLKSKILASSGNPIKFAFLALLRTFAPLM